MLKKSLFPIIAGLLLTTIAGCAPDDRQYFDFEIQEIDEALSPEVIPEGFTTYTILKTGNIWDISAREDKLPMSRQVSARYSNSIPKTAI